MDTELYDQIYEAFSARINPVTEEHGLFVQELAQTAAEVAKNSFQMVIEAGATFVSASNDYTTALREELAEQQEANIHLQETVRRLTRVDTGTATC